MSIRILRGMKVGCFGGQGEAKGITVTILLLALRVMSLLDRPDDYLKVKNALLGARAAYSSPLNYFNTISGSELEKRLYALNGNQAPRVFYLENSDGTLLESYKKDSGYMKNNSVVIIFFDRQDEDSRTIGFIATYHKYMFDNRTLKNIVSFEAVKEDEGYKVVFIGRGKLNPWRMLTYDMEDDLLDKLVGVLNG